MYSAMVDLVFVATALFGVGLAGIGLSIYREHDQPGVDAFATFCLLIASAAVLSAGYGLLVADPRADPTGGDPTTIGVWYQLFSNTLYLAPIPFVPFALQYTGRSRDLQSSTRAKAVFGTLVALVPIMLWIEYYVMVVVRPDLPVALVIAYLPVRIVATLFSMGVFLGAAALLVYTTYVYSHLDTAQGLALSAGAVVPLACIFLTRFLLASPAPAMKLLGFASGCLTFMTCIAGIVLGVYRYDAFRSPPAAGNVGREMLIEEIDDLVVVVDRQGRIAEVNPAAARTLSESRIDPMGDPVEDLLSVGVDELRETDSLELSTRDGRRQFDPQVSSLSDQHDREFGTVVTLRDVTRREIREQRLEVLNRVLRHNLRNKLAIVKGTADIIAQRQETEEHTADRLGRAADELMEMGEKAREIEGIMRQEESDDVDVPLTTVASDVVGEVSREFPAVAFETAFPSKDVVLHGDEDLFRHLIGNLVENAAEHNDADQPRVSVTVERRGTDELAIVVADNGPGIPEEELAVIQDGEETPLEHASGLGLWAANWCVARIGGEIAFGDHASGGDAFGDEGRGAVVTVSLPQHSRVHSFETMPGGDAGDAGVASGD